jgi:hypothetical protein
MMPSDAQCGELTKNFIERGNMLAMNLLQQAYYKKIMSLALNTLKRQSNYAAERLKGEIMDTLKMKGSGCSFWQSLKIIMDVITGREVS